MDSLQITQLPNFCAEMGSPSASQASPSHHLASTLSPPLLVKDAGISTSVVAGHIYSPPVQLPGVDIPDKWFEPNRGPDAFNFAILSNRIHELTSRSGIFEDRNPCNYTTPDHNIPETSRSGPFKDGSALDYSPSLHTTPDGKLKSEVISGLFQDRSLCNYTTPDSVPEMSRSGPFKDGSVLDNATPLHTIPDEKLKSKVIREQCQDSYVLPGERDFISVKTLCVLLDKCTMDKDIAGGRFFHSLIISSGFDFVPELCDNLIRLFGVCSSLVEADRLFLKVTVPRVSAWYAIMSAHAMHGDIEQVLHLYTRMKHSRISPSSFIFTCVVNSCTSLRALTLGEAVHNDIICSGLQSDLFVASALILFYSKCGSLSKAHNVFAMLPKKNVVIWSAMIGAYIQEGCLEQSFELLREMEGQCIEPNEYTYSSLISACGNASNLVQGMHLHVQFIKSGLNLDPRMASTLVDMYAKCGCLMEAHDVFDDLPNPTLICWNTLIAGYARNEHYVAALEVFDRMESEGLGPNVSTVCCSLKACGNLKAIEKGRVIHDQIITTGLDPDEYIQSNLIDMYCKCGCLDEARSVFDHWPSQNIVLWGALMAGYVQHDHDLSALEIFAKMQKNGIKPNVYIYSCVLQACGSLGALNMGIDIHDQIRKSGLEVCGFLGSSLIDMYSKCGNLETAHTVFEDLPSQNVVCWGAMIAGYIQHGHPLTAIDLYEKMISEGMKPDRVIYMYILEACSIMGSSDHGKNVHFQIIESGLGSDMVVGNSLVHMYIKCDCLQEAQHIFDALEERDKVSWDAMVVAYCQNSNFAMARDCLRGMAEEGFVADEILFTDILAACRRSGNIEEGWKFFKMISDVYGIDPSIEHFGCMVNLLGEGGYLLEAEELIEIMPIPPDSIAWLSLLSACRAHRKVDLGFRCFNEVVRLDPCMGMAYVLMSSIFAEASMWQNKHMIDEQRKQTDVWKIPGRAWIEVNKQVHEFMVGDRTHPQSNKIYATLRRLAAVLKDEGHVPQLGVVGGADDESEMLENSNEEALLGHCEKLAIAFGLFSMPEGATVRVVKNLRVCIDCHNVTKIISKVEKRDIIINDAYHVHHFSNGECSCEKDLISG